MTIQSPINDYAYYNSEEDGAASNRNSNPKVATHTSEIKKREVTDTDNTNRYYPRKLLISRIIPEIIPVAILPIYQTIVEDAAVSGDTLHARCTIISKEIVTDTARRAARVFRNPSDVSRHGTDGTTPQESNTAIGSTRLAPLVQIYE